MASIGSEASYTFQVVTRDNYGYLSLPSNAATYLTPSPSPSATPVPSTCSVIYRANGWGSGFTATISLKNIGTTPINGWKLTFAFPLTTQRVTNGWSATWTQTGTDVSATDTAWNRTIQPGQTFWLGFNGSHSGNNPSPTVFMLNGNTCESA
jgi:cellulose 1,4-beta-cellobiosidase